MGAVNVWESVCPPRGGKVKVVRNLADILSHQGLTESYVGMKYAPRTLASPALSLRRFAQKKVVYPSQPVRTLLVLTAEGREGCSASKKYFRKASSRIKAGLVVCILFLYDTSSTFETRPGFHRRCAKAKCRLIRHRYSRAITLFLAEVFGGLRSARLSKALSIRPSHSLYSMSVFFTYLSNTQRTATWHQKKILLACAVASLYSLRRTTAVAYTRYSSTVINSLCEFSDVEVGTMLY